MSALPTVHAAQFTVSADSVPTVQDRLNAIRRAILLASASAAASADEDVPEHRAELRYVTRDLLSDALDEIYWLNQVSGNALNAPAPDNDQREDMKGTRKRGQTTKPIASENRRKRERGGGTTKAARKT